MKPQAPCNHGPVGRSKWQVAQLVVADAGEAVELCQRGRARGCDAEPVRAVSIV